MLFLIQNGRTEEINLSIAILTFDTSGLWISRISRLAVADRVVVYDFTVGIRTAVAWADAESVDTRFTLSTFRIGSATDSWTNRCN
jgi:hypothetical protein